MYAQAPNFRSSVFGDAWWIVNGFEDDKGGSSAGGRYVCDYLGVAVARNVQVMLHAGLKPPFASWDGTVNRRVPADSVWGMDLMRGLWTYAKLLGADARVLSTIEGDAHARRVSPETLRVALWLLYFRDRIVQADTGPAHRLIRLHGARELALDMLALPADAITPEFGVAPQIPPAMAAWASAPVDIAAMQAGHAWPGDILDPQFTGLLSRNTMANPPAPRPGINVPLEWGSKGYTKDGGVVPQQGGMPTWLIVGGIAAAGGLAWWYLTKKDE
jgi:hypothetical protein